MAIRETKCTACKAKTIWVVTEKKPDGSGGKRMMVDVAPPADGKGNLWIVMTEPVPTSYVLSPKKLEALSEIDRAGLRISHFATCPEAQRFKGKRGTTAASEVALATMIERETGYDWPDELERSERPLVPAFTRAEAEERSKFQELTVERMFRYELSYVANSGGGEFVHPTKGRCQVNAQSPREDFETLRSWLVGQGLETSVEELAAEVSQ